MKNKTTEYKKEKKQLKFTILLNKHLFMLTNKGKSIKKTFLYLFDVSLLFIFAQKR